MTNRFNARNARALMWSTALTAIAMPSLAWAQAPTQPTQPQTAPAQATTSAAEENEIIITAQRRRERLEDVPMTVNVINPETMAVAGVNSVRDLANVTSGVTLNQGGAFPQPTIRGVTTVINGTYENNVAVYVDGLYQPAAQTINIDLPNVEGIQILKGPQGTLYGRNATGGAILVNTIMPSDRWQGKAELTYARFDDKRASGYVAGPISDVIGISLAGYMRRSDGYFKLTSRTVPGATDGNAAPLKQDSFRAKLKLEPSSNFRAILAYNYTRVSDPRGNMFSVFENVRSTLAPAFARMPKKLGQAAYDIGTVVQTKQHEGSLTMELDTGIGMLKSITGYSQMKARTSFDFDGSYLDGSWSTSLITERTLQQAVDFSINAIKNLDLVVGATYFHDHLFFEEPSDFYSGTSTDPGFTEKPLSAYTKLFSAFFDQKKDAWAAYFDATFHATSALSITLGGRYSSEDQDVSGRQDSILGVLVRAPNSKSVKFKKFTPRAVIRYEIAPRTNVYASYSQGFRSGTFNSQLPANQADWKPAKQEVIKAYELGFKRATRSYHVDLAAFYYDYSNLQVSSTITGAAGNPIVAVTNAPKAKVKGIEGSVEWEPVKDLTLRGGATYLHARFGGHFTGCPVGVVVDSFCFSTVGVNPALPGLNSNSDPLKTYRNVNQTQDLSGLQMSRAPKFAGYLGFDYAAHVPQGTLRFGLNAKYTSSYVVTNPAVWGNLPGIPVDRQRQQRFRQGSYVLLNASVMFTDASDHYYVRLWTNNLTDTKYRLHYTGNDTWGSYSPLAEPLTYGATIGYKF